MGAQEKGAIKYKRSELTSLGSRAEAPVHDLQPCDPTQLGGGRLPQSRTARVPGWAGLSDPGETPAESGSYLTRGFRMVHRILMKLVGCTTYRAFRFFLYLRRETEGVSEHAHGDALGWKRNCSVVASTASLRTFQSFFFLFYILFIYLFGCLGSSLQRVGLVAPRHVGS